jgi:hypothetical protein
MTMAGIYSRHRHLELGYRPCATTLLHALVLFNKKLEEAKSRGRDRMRRMRVHLPPRDRPLSYLLVRDRPYVEMLRYEMSEPKPSLAKAIQSSSRQH